MKAMTFETLVEKIAEREKAFGKKESKPNEETVSWTERTQIKRRIFKG